ncbi:DUF6924 domain-containing protein [Actinoplanes sp. NPDC051343]|uniref:DUF6924 domain-containing protein n=1 Tax=Actinoplanes sp. NPDC051343 TaxID=3363906 RepID=UPI0037B7635A
MTGSVRCGMNPRCLSSVVGSMRAIPSGTERGDYDAVIVRTDYSDAAGWLAVLAALKVGDTSGVGDEPLPWTYVIVEDAAWAGASVEDLVRAAAPDEYLSVVFAADQQTMSGPEHLFLAISAADPHSEYYAETVEYGRHFRIVPGQMPVFHANLDLGNMGFEEFAAAAQKDAEGVFRGFDD